ncbi:hypothetical protein F4555_001173 [Mobiluncus mulieris]|nr:hypothetical protein [Mobiluncus mulieris]
MGAGHERRREYRVAPHELTIKTRPGSEQARWYRARRKQ